MYTHPFSLRFFSRIDDHRIWGRVLCSRQQVPIGQSFHVPIPKPPVHLFHPLPPFPFGNCKFFQSLWVCLCSANKFICILFKDSTYKWYPMMFVFHCLISFSMIISRSIHVAWHCFILFYGWVIFHCIYVPYLLYPFLFRWAFRLFACLGYCRKVLQWTLGCMYLFKL